MKTWETPNFASLEIEETKNADTPGQDYDNEWAQDNQGQWYLLAKES